ncbi:hypothetical protein OAI00_01385 [Euryarchaeota archaeon]|nr:hypothetical protein [Euryarchaeota archaeon]
MRIDTIQLYNWTSFWNAPRGEEGSTPHIFSFKSDSNRNGYAIFGENSRGKTSFSSAVYWALYGEAWTIPVSEDGKSLTRERRPLVGHPNEENNPLLNTTSFREGNYNFYVVINFTHNSENYSLTRQAFADKDSVTSDDDMVVNLLIRNFDTKEEFFDLEAQEFIISDILPKNLSRFFFLDGESITQYRALIASKVENVELRSNIEEILNFPILQRGIKDIREIKSEYSTKKSQLSKDKNKNRKLIGTIDTANEEIKEHKQTIDAQEVLWKQADDMIAGLENELSLNKSSEGLIAEKDTLSGSMPSKLERLRNYYQRRKNENKELWLHLLQEKVKNELGKLDPMRTEIRKNNLEMVRLESQINHLKELDQDEENNIQTTCKLCNHTRSAKRSSEEKAKDLVDMNKYISRHSVLKSQTDTELEINHRYDKIRNFKNISRISIINQNSSEIKELDEEIRIDNRRIDDIESLLDGIDEEGVKKLRVDILEQVEIRSKAELRKAQANKKIAGLQILISESIRGQVGDDGSDEEKILDKKLRLLDWMEGMLSSVLNEYSQTTRIQVERIASDTFMSLTNNPEGLSGLTLNTSFGLTILDHEDFPVSNPTPGMMQCAAISLIDTLGKISNIEFPILFDTPGASIDQTHRDNIVSHYWNNRDVQFVIIPSSGEYRADEVESKYEEIIARTWELEFPKGSPNKTKVRNRMWN